MTKYEPRRAAVQKLYTHLIFGGNCEEEFRFYERHLDGKITVMIKGEIPTRPEPLFLY